MNIIIVGCGKVGRKIAEQLSREKDHDITVIDLKSDIIEDLTGEYDVMGVAGSGASLDTLMGAGIENADILIAVTGSDEINLLTCLLAKKAGNCQTIARVRKPEYGREISLFKEDLGLAMVINPEHAAALEIVRSLRFPSAIQIDTFAKGRMELLKFRISKDSQLDKTKIYEINQKLGCNILVCGVERGDEAFIPGGDFELRGGDIISIASETNSEMDFFKRVSIKTNSVRDAVIVGGGTTGYYLAKELLKTGIKVKIIENNRERCEELCSLLPGAVIINGDGTDKRVLLESGIEQAEAVVSLLNIDEENVLLSLFAKSKTNAKIVTKINRIAYDEVINSLDLDTTVYPKTITAEYIVRFVRAKNNSIGNNIETMHYVLEGKAEALEFKIKENSPISGMTIEKMKLKDNVIIACINRGGKIIIPGGQDVIKSGDTVIIVTTNEGFQDISDIFR